MLRGNEAMLDRERSRAISERTAIETSLGELSNIIRREANQESKRDLEQLLKEMEKQKASNEILQKTCEEALSKTKDTLVGIEQDITETTSDEKGKAVAGIINMDGEIRDVKQKISGTSAKGGSFAGAGVIRGVNLSL